MPERSLRYSRNMTPAFFSGASRDDVKWTINYLIGLLEVMESPKTPGAMKLTVGEARKKLRQNRLSSHSVPADFNGMRDEANPKYL